MRRDGGEEDDEGERKEQPNDGQAGWYLPS